MSQAQNKRRGQVRIYVEPQYSGNFTRWRLTGSFPTPVPHQMLRQLFKKLSFWNGWPVELVLPVDVGTVAWFDSWTDAIANIPAHHLQIRFSFKGQAERTSHEQGITTKSKG